MLAGNGPSRPGQPPDLMSHCTPRPAAPNATSHPVEGEAPPPPRHRDAASVPCTEEHAAAAPADVVRTSGAGGKGEIPMVLELGSGKGTRGRGEITAVVLWAQAGEG